jgi:hypothetical protein
VLASPSRRNAGQYVSKMFGLIRGITAQVFRKPDYLIFFKLRLLMQDRI